MAVATPMLTLKGMATRRIDSSNPAADYSGRAKIYRSLHPNVLVAPAGESAPPDIQNAIFEGDLSFPVGADGSFSQDFVYDPDAVLEVSVGAASGYLVFSNYAAGDTVYFDTLLTVLPDPITQTFYVTSVTWDNIQNKPLVFPADPPTWGDILDKPSTYPVDKVASGLDQVNNTTDLNKPVSTATQNAINALSTSITSSLNGKASNTHASTHSRGGSDAVTLTNLAAGGTSPVRRLRAASNGSLSWVEPLFVRKAADQQYLNTAALADVTNLGIDLEADSVYVGSAQITYSTGATSVKCNLGWTLPAGATMSWSANGISSAATTVAAAISRTNLTGAQSQNVGSAGASAIDALPTFIIMTGATAGRLQLQAAQGTADAVNALTIKANSWLRAERVV